MDPVGNRRDEVEQESAETRPRGLLVQLGEGELRGPIDGDEQVELALLGADLRDIDVEVAERISLELALTRGGALDLGQSGDAVPLQTAVQG